MKIDKLNIVENQFNEAVVHHGFVHKSEEERLIEDVTRSGLEKLQLFTKMLRRNATLKKANILNTPK